MAEQLAEQLAEQFARATGLEVRALQNNSRHGVDLYAYDPVKNQYIVFEVKSSTTGSFASPSTGDPEAFLRSRATRAEQGQGWWDPKNTPTDLRASGTKILSDFNRGDASVVGYVVQVALPPAPVVVNGVVQGVPGNAPKLTIKPWGGP